MVKGWVQQRDKENERVKQRDRVCHRAWLSPTCLCFHQRQPGLSWENLTDSSLYASLLCDSYHTTEVSALCSSSLSYSEGWKYIFPTRQTDTSLSLPTCLEKSKIIIMNYAERKAIAAKFVQSARQLLLLLGRDDQRWCVFKTSLPAESIKTLNMTWFMANAMNKSAVHSIIRAAETTLSSHYSAQSLACKDLCTDRSSITRNVFRISGL